MIEFFIALIGLGYYLTKFIDESAKSKAFDREFAAMQQSSKDELNWWLRRVTDKKLEKEIDDSLENNEVIEEYCDIIMKVYEETKDRPICYGPPEATVSLYRMGLSKTGGLRRDIKRMVLGYHGKMSEYDARYGISTTYFQDRPEVRMMTYNLCYWLDSKFRENGIKEQMVTIGAYPYYVRDDHFAKRYVGPYGWMPMLSLISRKNLKEQPQ